MKFIYAIICHKYTNSLIFTIKDLLKSKNSFVILHIDAKTTDQEIEKIKVKIGVDQNLEIIPRNESVNVKWGSFSQIEVMLILLKKASNYEFKYFSLISGDDIPIHDNSKRENFLINAYKDRKEFIGIDRNCDPINRLRLIYPEIFYNKSQSFYMSFLKRVVFIYLFLFRRKDLSNFPKIYKGCNWFTLTDFSVKYILDYIDMNPTYIKFFEKSFCADEVFFQTILFNEAKIKKNIFHIDDFVEDGVMAMRYIDWKTGPDYPRTLDETDFDRIKKSNLLFARKISNLISFDLLEKKFRK